MKKAYNKPAFDVTEFRFSEHIAASGITSSCHWGSSAYWSYAYEGCNKTYVPGTSGWIGLNS